MKYNRNSKLANNKSAHMSVDTPITPVCPPSGTCQWAGKSDTPTVSEMFLQQSLHARCDLLLQKALYSPANQRISKNKRSSYVFKQFINKLWGRLNQFKVTISTEIKHTSTGSSKVVHDGGVVITSMYERRLYDWRVSNAYDISSHELQDEWVQ